MVNSLKMNWLIFGLKIAKKYKKFSNELGKSKNKLHGKNFAVTRV